MGIHCPYNFPQAEIFCDIFQKKRGLFMSMKHVTVFSGLLLMAFFSLPSKAQSQSDINNLRALMP